MSQSKLAIALLSANVATYEQVTRLLGQHGGDGFTVTWIDLRQAPPPDDLPSSYDAYLSDAPLAYLLEHQNFVRNHICFWLVATEVAQTELFNQGVADCFLLSEFNATLLKHSLRRQWAIGAADVVSQQPLEELQGDHFRTLVNNLPGAVYRCLHSEEWEGMYVSEAIVDIVGYPAADFIATGDRTFISLIHPEDVTFIEALVNQQLAKQEPFALEYRLVHRDGSIRWIDERSQGVFDDNGNLLWIDGVILDISANKKLEQELQQQQRDYYEKTPAMLHLINEQDEIVAVSDRWLEVMGYERSEVIGRRSIDFLTIKSRHYAESQIFPFFLKNGYIEDIEYQFIKKNGEILDILLSATSYDYGGEKRFLVVLVDITTRNKLTAELEQYQNRLQAIVHQRTQALAISEKRFRTVFDLAPMGIVELDLQGQFRLVNRQFMGMLGLTIEALLVREIMDVIYGDDAEAIRAILGQLQAGIITTFSGDYRYCRGDTWFWGHLEIATVGNIHGEAEYFIATIEDIHSRKLMEESLRLSEARLAKAQAIAKVGIWEWELATNILFWSDEFYRLFDLEPQSIEPNFETFMAMVSPGDRPRIEAAIEVLKSGEKVYGFEYRITTAQNRQKIVLEHVDAVANAQGEVTHFSGTLQDVTDFREANLALQASETRFRELVEHIDECFWINPTQPTKIEYISPAYGHIWGRSCESLIADNSSWVESVHPKHLRQVQRAIIRMEAGQDFNEEYRIVRPDGAERWVYGRSAKILDENGTLLRHVGVVSDITERKQMELNLRASEARFRGIFDQAALGIAQVSLGDQFLLVNQAFCDLVGYTEAELRQMTWQDITHPNDLHLRQPSIDQIIARDQKCAVFEKRYIHKQGHIVWIKAIAPLFMEKTINSNTY
ncbi:MAG: PAS domain S-box protein [Limnothrix sp. RL_2_0]|nr:PAS domain S-box protein [Limnothrix sp. RL_2_0]